MGSPIRSSAPARRRAVLGVAVIAALWLASCGSDDDGSSSSTASTAASATSGAATTAPSSAGAATTTSGAGGTSPAGGESAGNPTVGTGDTPATGEPIKVMTVAPIDSQLPPYPNIHEAAKIYAQWLNDRGGINGRPLQVSLCDGKGDPNEDAACGRKAADEGDVALVGSFTFDASQLIPILEDENIAMFGSCCPIAAIEFSSPVSFVTGSNFAIPAGAVARMVDDGCKKPAVVFIETASTDFATSVSKAVFTFKGFDPANAKFITIPITAQDYSAQVAQAIDGTDCIYGGISDANWAAFLPAMQSLGGTQRLYGHQGNLNSKIAEAFPELTENGISVNSYPNIEGPMWADYRAALEQYKAPDLDWNSLAGLGTWSAFEEFVTIVQGMTGEINHDTFIDAVRASTNVDTGGMVPPLDLSKPWDGMGGQFPQIYNRSVTFDVIHDGKLTATDDPPEDMTEALNSWKAG